MDNKFTNELFLKIFKNLDDHENVVLSASIFDILKVLILAAEGENYLNKNKNVKNVIMNYSPSSIEKAMLLFFIPENKKDIISNEYKNRIKEILLANNTTFEMIETLPKEGVEEKLKYVNTIVEKMFGKEMDSTYQDFIKDLLFDDDDHDQIYFNTFEMNWKYPFLEMDSKNKTFHISSNKTKNIPMNGITRSTIIKSIVAKKFGELVCDVYQFPSGGVCRRFSMLTILPRKISTTKKLINCIIPNMSNIIEDMKEEGKELAYNEIYMPKFKYECYHHKLDEVFKKIPELEFIANDESNFDGILKKNEKNPIINLKILNSINNHKMIKICLESLRGGEIPPKTDIKRIITLDKPFVYCICDEIDNKILYVGTFTFPSSTL